MDELTRVCQFVLQYRAEHPDSQKDEIAAAAAQQFGLKSARKIYVGRDFAIRFSHASGASFSNVVLSLSALKPFDDRPFVVCVVRPSSVEFLLANTTFLKKISHSSHQLRVDIKTKVLTLQSNPKGFNIDKYLRTLSEGDTLISFFFVGIDPGVRAVRTGLASTLDESVINATHVQFHWSGRNSRGVTQLTRDVSAVFAPGFRERVDAAHARVFLQELMEL